jgi:hypothetical protein
MAVLGKPMSFPTGPWSHRRTLGISRLLASIGIRRICGNNLHHRLILVHTMAMSITFVSKYYCILLLPFCGHCEGCTELRFRAVSSRICEAPTRKTNEVYLISCGSFKNPRNSPLGFLMGVFLKSPTMPHFRCHLCNTE